MKQQAIIFSCEQLILHGYRYSPDNPGKFPGVVICHPHSLYGGSMDSIVVKRLAFALTDRNIASLIFNFRGVGSSQGTYGEGIAEQDDVTSAIDWLTAQPDIDNDKIGLAGYSFGGGVSIPVACRDKRVKALSLISPMLTDDTIELLAGCTIPKLFIVGENDDTTPPRTIEAAYNNTAKPKQYNLIPQADHFFEGKYRDEVVNLAADFLAGELNDK
jgi:alpha/beta superfamily hydrolase